ncbi:hypothetical protein GCM10010885_24200 [Alicyclobacillus cellulosilyticus]|uniref:Transposase/invertase (TIGR01784 family) n=1 Tax=Alicyclobacillus cellulosilyticus TaxID=1003997 RepID=A0A917KHH9_9BACL|nr:hypothetical protein [Alicyclobacillus cellulosilyticus]GGJ14011.1 hypothetical protein GCM10010885_24200 [Alicyclobacillus cellulosilyticus]
MHQAKDIIQRKLAQGWSNGGLAVLGLPDLRLVEALSTDLPSVENRQVDMLWRTDSGLLLHLEFQTSFRQDDLHRFLEYDALLFRRYQHPIRTVVLYASAESVADRVFAGSICYRVENIYLSKLDGDEALDIVMQDLRMGVWTPEDRTRLALALCMKRTRKNREEAFRIVISIMERLPQDERDFVTAAILGLSGRVLSDDERKRLEKELIRMSKMAEEIFEMGEQKGLQQGRLEVARNLLKEGMAPDKVASLTNLPVEEVRKLLN